MGDPVIVQWPRRRRNNWRPAHPKHRLTPYEVQKVYALAHTLPEHVYGPVGHNEKCGICNPQTTANGRRPNDG